MKADPYIFIKTGVEDIFTDKLRHADLQTKSKLAVRSEKMTNTLDVGTYSVQSLCLYT